MLMSSLSCLINGVHPILLNTKPSIFNYSLIFLIKKTVKETRLSNVIGSVRIAMWKCTLNQLLLTFFKAYIVVNVHHLSSGHVNQHIVKVAVAKADDVSHH